MRIGKALTLMSGNNCPKARAAVDFPVPFGPRINIPPIRGSTAFSSKATRVASCATMAENE